ncbi:MAG: EAL domain-containing protein [Spirochaetia bacterium]|nr:EAL domain-containing protein [Spirochaetia bacterium]
MPEELTIANQEEPLRDDSTSPSVPPSDRYFGLRDEESFKKTFIEANRGKPLIMIRFQNIQGMDLLDFVGHLRENVHSILDTIGVEFGFHYIDSSKCLLMGVSPLQNWNGSGTFPNIDNAVGRFHDQSSKSNFCAFDFGVSRTQCNYISHSDEIFKELSASSQKNLNDNLVRWSWTYFNRANAYFAANADEAVIQPTVYYDPKDKTFSVKGGEVFVGGALYQRYADLIGDIPEEQDINRIELLILEKLLIACERTPGLLKFNMSPQSLIDTFSSHDKVSRFNRLLHAKGLNPSSVRLELVEKPYEERERTLKDVCQDFWNFGVSFAADDFGLRSQSHQVVLELGLMIKEFKLDPISFKFKAEEDKTKFLDNLAFIAYCKRLADNREAVITAEAVEDYDTLNFLMELHIYQYQTNLFCAKMPVTQYRRDYEIMKDLPEDVIRKILMDDALLEKQREQGNIFALAKESGLWHGA